MIYFSNYVNPTIKNCESLVMCDQQLNEGSHQKQREKKKNNWMKDDIGLNDWNMIISYVLRFWSSQYYYS